MARVGQERWYLADTVFGGSDAERDGSLSHSLLTHRGKMPKRTKPISFTNEHTAEYFLIHNFVELFSRYFVRILPLYFWLNREGCSISRECCENGSGFEKLRTIAVFARRPKIHQPRQRDIVVKFNREVLNAATVGHSLGVPTFAGVPMVSSITDLFLGVRCAWFDLNGGDYQNDISCVLDIETGRPAHAVASDSAPPVLDDSGFLNIIYSDCIARSWAETLDAMKEIRRNSGQEGGLTSGWRFRGYKPFFLVLIENNQRHLASA